MRAERTREFCFEAHVPEPLGRVFALHEDPEHLVLLHRQGTAVRMLHHDGHVRVGAETWIEFNLGGLVPVVMGFWHIVYDPPRRFGERMIHGPFACFVHIHEFEVAGEGTTVRDRLQVAVPWQYGGDWALRWLMGPLLSRVFVRRGRALRQFAVGGGFKQRGGQ